MNVTNISQNNFPQSQLQPLPQEVSKKDLAYSAASVALLSFCTMMTCRYARQQGMQNLSNFSPLLPETCWPEIQKRTQNAKIRQNIPSGPTIMGHINPLLLLPESRLSQIQKRALNAMNRQNIPSGPTIEGYPSYVRLNYRSANEVIKVAHDLMKSGFSKKEKIQRIQELPLRQFGMDPEFFLSRLRKSQYR